MAGYPTVVYEIIDHIPVNDFNLGWATTRPAAVSENPDKTASQVKSLYYKEFSKWLKQGFVARGMIGGVSCALICGHIEGDEMHIEFGLVMPDENDSVAYFSDLEFLEQSEQEWKRFLLNLGLKKRVDYIYEGSTYYTRRKYLATLPVCQHTLEEVHVANLPNGKHLVKLIGTYFT
jgi:hypothetical protein